MLPSIRLQQSAAKMGNGMISVNGRTFVGTEYNGAWFSPEVYQFQGARGQVAINAYRRDADIWPLGLLFFYISSRGYCPIMTPWEVTVAGTNQESRLEYLRRTRGELISLLNASNARGVADDWRLCSANPLLFDLVEHMVRPRSERISLADCAAHPFFWDLIVVERVVLEFAIETANDPAARRVFREDLDARCESYLAEKGGWDVQHPMFRGLDYPETYEAHRNSAHWLLKAVRNMLVHHTGSIQTANVSSRMVREDVILTLQKLYPTVLLKLFELTLQCDAAAVLAGDASAPRRKYGVWSGAFTEQFCFTFHA
jgi:hypothetical protein